MESDSPRSDAISQVNGMQARENAVLAQPEPPTQPHYPFKKAVHGGKPRVDDSHSKTMITPSLESRVTPGASGGSIA